MRSRLSFALLLTAFAVLGSPVLARAPLSDTPGSASDHLARALRAYNGSCPCPYNKAKNASNCGMAASAYSRARQCSCRYVIRRT